MSIPLHNAIKYHSKYLLKQINDYRYKMTHKRLYSTPTLKCIVIDTQGVVLTGSEIKASESIERGKLVDFDFDDPLSTNKNE